ncbi:MAG: hypothetical protein KDK27_09165, partial [Leptospiraceae bacterium]|nr:hypothetical protein [Leptospiraceae bacterium]
YLIDYPYGCTEQLISGAFPALIFADQPELMVSGDASRATVQRALDTIRTRQNENGEIAYWTPGLYSDSFFNVYAAHFVLEAQERGHAVPERMRALSLEGLNRQARGVIAGSSPADFRAAAYAVYVLTRSGLVTTNILTELHGELREAHSEHDLEWERDITAAFLAASHQLLKQSDRAEDLIEELEFDPEWEAEQSGYYYTPEVHNALLAYVLAMHFPDKRADLDARRLSTLAVPERFQTLSAALSILALDALAGDPRLIAGLSVSAQMNDGRSVPLSMRGRLFPRSEFPDSTKSLLFNNSGNLLYFYQMTRAGFPVQPPRADIEQGMQIYRDIRKDGQSTQHVRVGDELTIHLRARADEITQNVSIVDLLPGGLEPLLRQSPDQERDSEWREGGWRFPLGTMQSTLVPDHMDMREDRIILFTPVTDELREFVYKVRAVNAGKFQIPPVYAEAMYDRNLKAISVNGDTLTIDPPDFYTQPVTETARRNTVP